MSAAPMVLDTSAYSRFRAGHDGVLGRIATATIVCVPATVLGELEAGFMLGSRRRENQVTLEEFLDEPFVRVVTVGPDVARHYGRVFAGLRRAGTPIPTNDMWIAACTLHVGGRLVTFDSDFERVEALEVELLQ